MPALLSPSFRMVASEVTSAFQRAGPELETVQLVKRLLCQPVDLRKCIKKLGVVALISVLRDQRREDSRDWLARLDHLA